MKHVRVSMTAGGREAEIHPMYDVMANAPFVERATAVQWNFTGDAVGFLHYVEGDAEAFEESIATVESVVDYELEPVGEDAFYAYIRDAPTPGLRALVDPLTTGGVVVVPPIHYHADGTVTLSAFGPGEEIQAVLESIPSPVTVEVEEVGGLSAVPTVAETRLSDRQRRALTVAHELGYYERPKRASVADVADRLDCAKSTAGEHLRKAESKLVEAVLAPGAATL